MRRSSRRTGAVEEGKDLVDLGFHGDGGEGVVDFGDTESTKGTASSRRAVRKGVRSSGDAEGGGSWARFMPQRRINGPKEVSVDIVVANDDGDLFVNM